MRKEKNLVNFLPINRRFFLHPFWQEERTFSKSEAWLDLIQRARFEESEAAELMGGKMVRWTRGQAPLSLRFLAEAWKWSKNKVDDFLKMLENEGQIRRDQQAGQTIITLLNYNKYNGQQKGQHFEPSERISQVEGDSKKDSESGVSGQQKGQQKGHKESIPVSNSLYQGDSKKDSEGDTRGTAGGHAGDKSNIDNKVKKGEEKAAGAAALSLEVKFEKFRGWIKENAPRVLLLKEPFTSEQYQKLRAKYHHEDMMDVLLAMHNFRDLLKKYESAYLTANNWLKMRAERGENRTDKKTNDANEAIKAAIQRKGAERG